MKNQSLKNLKGITAHQLLSEMKTVRKRVSGYADDRRARLVESAMGAIHGHTHKKASCRA